MEKCYLDYLQNFESYLQHFSISLYGTTGNISNSSNIVIRSENFFPKSKDKSTLANIDKSSFFSENEDDDDEISESDVNVRNITKVSTQKFTKLSLSGASDLDNLRKNSSNLKMAWI